MTQPKTQITHSEEEAAGGKPPFDHINRLVPVLIGIFVLFISIPHTTAIKEITLYAALFCILVLFFAGQTDFTLNTPLTLPFAFFLVWAVMGVFFSLNKPNTIHDIYAHYLKYLAVFFIVVNFYRTESRFRILVRIVALSAAVFALGGMISFYGIEGRPLSDRLGFEEMSSNYLGFI
ncbi:MAG TPA: hypothetical protein P5244_16545, partial [Syntrophales bacterium]|nr:hypothetical protein [Syntrophales bacterium]